ncbi:MAG: hypothetical protein ACLP36_01990 [Acidimicrobiales bacterium]
MLNTVIDKSLAPGQVYDFKISATCAEGQTSNFVLHIRVLQHEKLAYSLEAA